MATKEKREFVSEYRFQKPDGTVTWLDGHAVMTKTNGNIGFIGTISDITRSKEQQDELNKINEVMTGREVRMIELKKEIKALKERLDKYESTDI